jgi:pimeloyl-ACP methyl ester carboxylesterase
MYELRTEQVQANGLDFQISAAGSGDRLALCLHGFPECAYSWRHQLPWLAERGFLAWAPDLRGYGGTTRPESMRDYAIENLLDDVAGLIDASGARETMLLAHDWGAVVAWLFAMHRVRPLERLVILNVPHPAVGERTMRTFEQMRRSWYVLFFQLPWLPEKLLTMRRAEAVARAFRDSAIDKSRFRDEDLEVYRRNALGPGAAKAMLDYYRALVRGGGARRLTSRGYPKIETPTLLLWGVEDVALSIRNTWGVDEWVSDLVVRRLPGVSHWSQQEAPETVNEMIGAWLDGEPVPQAPGAERYEPPADRH